MRTKTLLLAAVCAVMSLSLVPSASAKSSSLFVTTTPAVVDVCRPTPEQIGFRWQFTAKIKRRNSPKPKNVRVEFKVTDASTGGVLATGKVTLTPRNKFKNKSAPIVVPAGASLIYNFQSVYNAPNKRNKRVSAKGQQSEVLPTAAQLDTAQPPLPTVCV
jgi:hypothetical protein